MLKCVVEIRRGGFLVDYELLAPVVRLAYFINLRALSCSERTARLYIVSKPKSAVRSIGVLAGACWFLSWGCLSGVVFAVLVAWRGCFFRLLIRRSLSLVLWGSLGVFAFWLFGMAAVFALLLLRCRCRRG